MELAPYLVDTELQRKHLDDRGFTHASIMVPPFVTLYDLPVSVTLQYAKAFNEGAAQVAAVDPRFFALATVPLQDPEVSAAEMRRAVTQLGCKGAGIITKAGRSELAVPEMDVFYREVEALGVPIFIHPDVQAPVGTERMGPYYLRNLVGNPSETALTAAYLVFSGVLDRFPNLVFVLAHGGGSFPYIIGRLEHGYKVRPECHHQKGSPASYLRRFYYDTVVFEPKALRYLVSIAGADRVVVGTDWPFDMADPDPVDTIRKADLGPEATKQVFGLTAAGLLGLGG